MPLKYACTLPLAANLRLLARWLRLLLTVWCGGRAFYKHAMFEVSPDFSEAEAINALTWPDQLVEVPIHTVWLSLLSDPAWCHEQFVNIAP